MITKKEILQLDSEEKICSFLKYCIQYAKEVEISEVEIPSYEFIFWHIYLTEYIITRNIIINLKSITKPELSTLGIPAFILSEMDFRSKIKLFKFLLTKIGAEKEFKEFIDYLNRVYDIRNLLFHQKVLIKNIKYNNKAVLDLRTKQEMVWDLFFGLNRLSTILNFNL